MTKATVLSLRDELRAEGLAESSVGSILVVLRSVFAYARHADYTTTDPFRGSGGASFPHLRSPKEKRVLRAERDLAADRRDAADVHGDRDAAGLERLACLGGDRDAVA